VLYGDVRRFQSLIINMLITALKVSSGLIIELSGSYSEEDEELVMQVAYKGIAIPNLANYTDLSSLERDTEKLNGGELNVIGLFMAKRVCKMYHGDI